MINKIIYISSARLPTEKAHGLQIMKSCEAFAELGMNVELVTPRRFNVIKEDAFSYYKIKSNFKIKKIPSLDLLRVPFLPGRFSFYILSVSFSIPAILYAMIKRRKDTLIYCRDPIVLFFLCLIGFRPIAEMHDYKSEKSRRDIRLILGRSLKIIANSQGTLNKLKQYYNIGDEKIMAVPNGVDLEFFDIKESKEEARKLLNMPQESIIVAYIGRIETAGVDKGIGLLIKSFYAVKDNVKNTILYVIGGPDDLAEYYKNEALSSGIDPNMVTFTGFVSFRQIPLYLRAVDIMVIPLPRGKHAEITSPIKLFEFLAAGKAIIAPDFPSFREYIDEANTFFFTPDDQVDLARKITYAVSNPDLVKEKGEKSKELAGKFTWRKRAEKIIRFIKI